LEERCDLRLARQVVLAFQHHAPRCGRWIHRGFPPSLLL
jgi:hypothetical protein